MPADMARLVENLAIVHGSTVTKILTKLVQNGIDCQPAENLSEARRMTLATEEAALVAQLDAVREKWRS